VPQEGKQQAKQTPLSESTRKKTAESPKLEIYSPKVVRKAKSFTEYYNVVRSQMKEELREEKYKRRQRHQLNSEVEFESWYGGIQNDLVNASHEEYRCVRLYTIFGTNPDRLQIIPRSIEAS